MPILIEVADLSMESANQLRYHRLLRGYLIFLCAFTLVTAVHITRVPSKFTLDDWLINYEGGFVRRGLIGQVILYIRHVLPVSGLYPAAVFALVCYSVIFYAAWRLISNRSVDIWVTMLVMSPVTLAFAVIDNRAWGHKEVLFLAGLGGLLLWLMRRKQQGKLLMLGMALYCPFLILCHEPLACFLPYYIAAVIVTGRSLKNALKIVAIPMLLTAATLAVVLRYPGTTATAAKICDSQGDPSRQLCQGAIAYLGTPPNVARSEVVGDARRYHFHAMYLGLTLLAIIPFVATCNRLWRYREARYELIVLGHRDVAFLSGLGRSVSLCDGLGAMDLYPSAERLSAAAVYPLPPHWSRNPRRF
jgi:hypothetical protein